MRSKFSPNDLRQRLEGSVIRYKDQPVYVMVDGTNLLLYSMGDSRRSRPIIVAGNDENLDVSTVPLGYVNWKTEALYVTREPVRRYKQGIDEGCTRITNHKGEPSMIRWTVHNVYLEKCILNDYPSLKVVLERLRDNTYTSQAINRDVALSINSLGIVHVYFKTELVGWIAPGKSKVNVPSSSVGWIISKNLEGFDWEVE